MQKWADGLMDDADIARLYKAVMDPVLFSFKDSSIATVAKLSREFEDELEEVFMLDKVSSKLLRAGTINITVDTKVQKEAYLISNFGVETTCTDLVPYEGMAGQNLLDMLSKAKEELALFQPPTPTLRCSYKEYERVSKRKSIVKVSFNKIFDQND